MDDARFFEEVSAPTLVNQLSVMAFLLEIGLWNGTELS